MHHRGTRPQRGIAGLEQCLPAVDPYSWPTLDMRKTRVPVCPRCTWPCDSPDTHGAVLTLHDIRPRQWGETNPLARDRDSASSP